MGKVPKAKCHKCVHCEKIQRKCSLPEVKCDVFSGRVGLAIGIPLYCRHFEKIKKGGKG